MTHKEIEESLVAIGFDKRVYSRILIKFAHDKEYTIKEIESLQSWDKQWLNALVDELEKVPSKRAEEESDATYEKYYGDLTEY